MNKRSIRDVQQVLDRHATTRSLDELAAAGRRQVRAISEEKLLGLIGALVDESIAAEAGTLRKQDRERIVARARDALGRVTRAQAEAEAKIARQAETIDALSARAEEAAGEQRALAAEVEAARARALEVERSATRAVDLAETRLRSERAAAETRLEQAAASLDEARATVAARDAALAEARAQLEAVRQQERQAVEGLSKRFSLAEREANERAERTAAALTALREELVRGQAEREQETAAARDALASLRAELAGPVRDVLGRIERSARAAAERPAGPDSATVDALAARLAGGQRAAAEQLQQEFDATLARALAEVERALRRATARPVDEPVEATDALLGKIFDGEGDPQTNYDQVRGAVRRSSQRISRSLQQLKALRRSEPDGDR